MVTYNRWVSSHSPDEIREANNARRALSKIAKEPKPAGRKSRLVAHRIYPIKDDRLVKRPITSYSAYIRDRWASGDFRGVTVSEASKAIGREWKSLSRDEAKVSSTMAEFFRSR